MSRIKDISGNRYNRYKVLKYHGQNKHRSSMWLCLCDCGTEKVVNSSDLKSGAVKSCGCLCSEVNAKKQRTHGMTGTRQYTIWSKMIQRCKDKNAINYNDYGGRGIKVCDNWEKFEGFWESMKSTYQNNLTLERIEVNGNYEPSNCRWATELEQANNKRNTVFIEVDGLKISSQDWCREHGFDHRYVQHRIRMGWSSEEISKSVEGYNKLTSAPSHNTSGIRGVSWYKRDGKWRAHIVIKQKQIHLGYFDSIEEAEAAVIEGREKYMNYSQEAPA